MINLSEASKEKLRFGSYCALGGAIGIMVLGAFWPGWNLASTTRERVDERVHAAQLELLAPRCAAQFAAQPDFAGRQDALKKAGYWNRANHFKGHEEWITLPGGTEPDQALVERCTALILETPTKAASAI